MIFQHDLALFRVDCREVSTWINKTPAKTYRSQHDLVYPINVARNVARETAYTHYIFPADIELYPNPGFIL